MAAAGTQPPVVTANRRAFDNAAAPVLEIDDGDTVVFECPSAFDWGPDATVADIVKLDLEHPHILTGPVAVRGAEPGDALTVDIVDVSLTTQQGIVVFGPGFGLLTEDFGEEVYLHVVRYADGMGEVKPGVRVPLEPFLGIMGVAPAERGEQSTVPPRPVGGNLDNRHLRAGSRLVLPVAVPGALFSCGDGHAAQGDGEVCGTAIETNVRATLKFGLQKDAAPATPEAFITRSLERPDLGPGYAMTTGVGPDLHACAKDAVRNMIELLIKRHGLSRSEAYVLCSIGVDLKISEVVNSPAWVVSAYLPLSFFDA